jgi:hypothetical protein
MSRRPIWRNRRKSKGSINAADMAEPSGLPLIEKQFASGILDSSTGLIATTIILIA